MIGYDLLLCRDNQTGMFECFKAYAFSGILEGDFVKASGMADDPIYEVLVSCTITEEKMQDFTIKQLLEMVKKAYPFSIVSRHYQHRIISPEGLK